MVNCRREWDDMKEEPSSTIEIYEEFVAAHVAKESTRDDFLKLSQSLVMQRFRTMVFHWCEQLAVEMAVLEVSRVYHDDESTACAKLFVDNASNKLIHMVAPIVFQGRQVAWLHQTIGEYFAARQCISVLDRLTFLHHEPVNELASHGAGESLVDHIVLLVQNEVTTFRGAEDDEIDISEVLKRRRGQAVRVLRQHAPRLQGLFKADEAAEALQQLLRQVAEAAHIGINRFRLQALPEVKRFLQAAVLEEPSRRSALIALVKVRIRHTTVLLPILNYSEPCALLAQLSSCHSALIPLRENSLRLLDDIYLEQAPRYIFTPTTPLRLDMLKSNAPHYLIVQ